MPAIVVFCLFYGIAIQRIENKQGVLSATRGRQERQCDDMGMGRAHRACGSFRLVCGTGWDNPYRASRQPALVFAVFLGGALILAFWVIPCLIDCLVPIGYRELLKELSGAIVIAVVTSLPVTSVPFLVQLSERLAARFGVKDPDRDEIISTTIDGKLSVRSAWQPLRILLHCLRGVLFPHRDRGRSMDLAGTSHTSFDDRHSDLDG